MADCACVEASFGAFFLLFLGLARGASCRRWRLGSSLSAAMCWAVWMLVTDVRGGLRW